VPLPGEAFLTGGFRLTLSPDKRVTGESSRSATNFECRNLSASVHSKNSTTVTSLGRNRAHFFIFPASSISAVMQQPGRVRGSMPRSGWRQKRLRRAWRPGFGCTLWAYNVLILCI
jgi:hypothetical protein